MPADAPPVDAQLHDFTAVEPVFNALRRLVHTLHTASRDTERRLGVTGAQLFVLTQLRLSPSLSINALAERTMTHQSTVSVVVQRLVDRKLVMKTRSSEDRRRVELSLTPAGTALLRRAPEVFQVRLLGAIEQLTESDRAVLARTVSQIVTSLGGNADAPASFMFETTR